MSKISHAGSFAPLVTSRQASAAQPPQSLTSIVVPTCRRIYPELLAHEVVGVQPMSGPVGFAFALKARYGDDIKGAYKEWKKTHGDEDRGFAHFKKHTWPILKTLKTM